MMKGKLVFVLFVPLFLLMFSACKINPDDPWLTGLILRTEEDAKAGNWSPVTTAAVGTKLWVSIRVENNRVRIVKFDITIKRDGTTVSTSTTVFSPEIISSKFERDIAHHSFIPAGSYTVAVYVTDSESNQSNLLTTSLTIY